MGENVIFNFGLLFEEKFSSELMEVSSSFAAHKRLDYALGKDSLPHVTILQFPGELAEAESIWARLMKLDLPPIKLHFHGLAFDRFRNWDGIWLRIKYSQEIRDAQRAAKESLGNLDYVNGLGDLYEPHATLAAWPKEEQLPNFPIPAAALDRRDISGIYTLGTSGPNFEYQKRLFAKA